MIGQLEVSDREIVDAVAAVASFLEPPLYSTAYGSGMGTLYTAVYKSGSGSAEYHWPGIAWEHSFEGIRARAIRLLASTAA